MRINILLYTDLNTEVIRRSPPQGAADSWDYAIFKPLEKPLYHKILYKPSL